MDSKYFKLTLAIVGIILVSGCTVNVNPAEKTQVEIKSAQYQAGNLLVVLYANESVKTVRIDILNNQGEVLCSKYKDLAQGTNQLELTECEVENDIKVSVSSSAGLITNDFNLNLPVPSAKIVDVKYEQAGLVVTFDADLEIKNARFEAVSKAGNVLCTKYIDLDKGVTQKKFTGCRIEEKLVISFTPPEGKLVTKDVTLEMPLLELRKGFRYDYSVRSSASSPAEDVSVYAIDETREEWTGIAGIKKSNKNAHLIRYKINKSTLSLQATGSLSESQLGQAGLEYKIIKDFNSDYIYSLTPFWLLMLKENGLDVDELVRNKTATTSQGQAITVKIEDTTIKNNFLAYSLLLGPGGQMVQAHVATLEPYIVLHIVASGMDMLSFKSLEKREFSLNDYAGYAIASEEKTLQTQKPVQEPERETVAQPTSVLQQPSPTPA